MKQKFTKGKELHILDFKCVSFQLNKNGTSFLYYIHDWKFKYIYLQKARMSQQGEFWYSPDLHIYSAHMSQGCL